MKHSFEYCEDKQTLYINYNGTNFNSGIAISLDKKELKKLLQNIIKEIDE